MTPRLLPAEPPRFYNRDQEVHDYVHGVTSALEQNRTSLVALWGMPGIGKSALAVRMAYTVRASLDFPGGEFYYSLRGSDPAGPAAPSAVLRHFLRQAGVQEIPSDATLSELAAQFRSRIADSPVLMVLDDAATAAQIRQLLPASPRSVVIVTSISRLDGLRREGFELVEVSTFSDDHAERMFADTIGRTRLDAEPEATQGLIQICAGLPLALSLVSARAAAQARSPLAGLVTRLSCAPMTDMRITRDESLREHIDSCYRLLTPDLAEAYRMLGTLPGPQFGVGVVAALLDTDDDTALELLEGLIAASFVRPMGTDHFQLHNLIAAHAAHRAETEMDDRQRLAARRRIAEYHHRRAIGLGRVVSRRPLLGVLAERTPPAYTGPHAMDRALDELEFEASALKAVVRSAAADGFDEITVGICQALKPWYYDTDRHDDLVELLTLAVAAADRLVDQPLSAMRTHHDLGSAHEVMGMFTEALREFDLSRRLAENHGDLRGLSSAIEAQGLVYEQTGRGLLALECFAEAQRVLTPLTDTERSIALLDMHRGRVLLDLGDVEAGGRRLSAACEYFAAENEPLNEGRCLELLARTHGDDHQRVISLLGEALHRFRAVRFLSKQADTHARLTHPHHALAAFDTAAEHAVAARDLFHRLGKVSRVAEMTAFLTSLGR